MNNVIAICGYKGSGKETVAKMIRLHLYNRTFNTQLRYEQYHLLEQDNNMNFDSCEIIHFATPLKKIASILTGFDPIVYSDRETKEAHRAYICHLGDVLKDAFGPNVLLNVTKRKLANKTKFFIVEDLRLPVEEEYLNDLKAIIIRVERPDVNLSSTHITETNSSNIKENFTILNDGDFDSLFEKVKEVIDINVNFKFLLV